MIFGQATGGGGSKAARRKADPQMQPRETGKLREQPQQVAVLSASR